MERAHMHTHDSGFLFLFLVTKISMQQEGKYLLVGIITFLRAVAVCQVSSSAFVFPHLILSMSFPYMLSN